MKKGQEYVGIDNLQHLLDNPSTILGSHYRSIIETSVRLLEAELIEKDTEIYALKEQLKWKNFHLDLPQIEEESYTILCEDRKDLGNTLCFKTIDKDTDRLYLRAMFTHWIRISKKEGEQ